MKRGFQKIIVYKKISCPICLQHTKNHVINHHTCRYLCLNCYNFLKKYAYLDNNIGGGFVNLTFDKYDLIPKYMISLIFLKTVEK